MKSISLIILFAGIVLSAKPDGLPEPDQVIELFRHGARGPLSGYDSSWSLDQWGMLTPVGMRQQYILGKVLADKYPDVVGAAYNYSQVYLLSDVTPRCIQSAGGHLYGMYLGTGPALPSNYPPGLAVPPFQDIRVQEIADSLPDSEALPYHFVPGVINIVDDSNGMIFTGDQGTYCPNQVLWESQNGNDSIAQQGLQMFAETIANVNKHLDESDQLTTVEDIYNFGDVFLVDLYDNRTLPGGISDPQLITNMTWVFSWFTYHLWEGQLQQRQTAAFNLIQAFLGQLEAYRNGTNYNKLAMLSGHDDNILAVLAVFGVVNEDCLLANFYSILANGTLLYPACYYPYFASDLIVEFFNQTDTPYVKMFYNNQIIPICGGQYTCPYDEFVTFAQNATGNLTLSSYFQVCGANSTHLSSIGYSSNENFTYNNPIQAFIVPNTSNTRIEILAIVGLVLLVVMLFIKMVYDKKRYVKEIKTAKGESMLYTQLVA